MHDDVVGAVVNFNTAALTRRCTRSLGDAGIEHILVLDNGSDAADYELLRKDHDGDPRIRIVRSEANLGFAQGSNRLIDEALADPRCARVLLLNSDAVADAAGTGACLDAMRESGADLMGGRMLKPRTAAGDAVVDSLGISLYKSLLASNRKSTDDAYLGPTGGYAVLSRGFLERAKTLHGYVFDPSYFCYAEDTDLCVRARLLGERVGYCDETVAYHSGQGSTTGTYSEFILYHGIRNSIWMAMKSLPAMVLVCHLPWMVALHGGIVLRHTLQGRFKTLFLLYRDAICGMGRVLRERKTIQATRKVTAREFAAHIDRQFYETAFVGQALRDLFRRG